MNNFVIGKTEVQYKHMKIKELEHRRAEDRICRLQQIVLEAANDWPDQIKTTEDFVSCIEQKIGSIANKANMELWVTHADVGSEAWYIESLGTLLELYSLFCSRLPVKDIFGILDNPTGNG